MFRADNRERAVTAPGPVLRRAGGQGRQAALPALAALALLFALLAIVPSARAAATPLARVPSPGAAAPTATLLDRTAALLEKTEAPGRDLLTLTRRFKLGGAGEIPSVVNRTAPDYPVGTRQRFWVADVMGSGYYSVYATIRVITAHAYWYVKDGHRVDMRRLQQSANRFEAQIYPTDRRVFGSEASPGIDNDPRITVLLAPIAGVGGYFSASDAYPRIVNPYSNERDMIYMSALPEDRAGDPQNYFEATLAHEFQHMIEWNINRDREVWLDEGCSEIASYVSGYDVGGTDQAFTADSDTQLNAWSETEDSPPHYGASYLFLRYLMDHYGGERFMTVLLRENGLGIAAVDRTVRALGGRSGFEGAYEDWLVANVLNDRTLGGGRYAYSEGGRVEPGRAISAYPATRSDSVHQYGADYIRLSGTLTNGTISFKGSSTARVTGAGAHSGQTFWYSNRRDLGDSTLTRELDLTTVRRASLRFAAWYDIESGYDYAYVSASTDGGKSWRTLRGRNTTGSNPNGANLGNGWTGKSGVQSAQSSAAARWVDESVDLTAYAGKRVLVRFEYVTDEGYNRPGLAVDDISVPEIGYSDSAEADNGWDAKGFVRIGDAMPQRWFVALVERGGPGKPNSVRTMAVDASGNGTLNLSTLAPLARRDAILVVSALAPKTTAMAGWTVTVRSR